MLERTVATEENPTRNLYYLGREYWYKQMYQKSIDTFERYVKISEWPAEKAEAYMNMGQSYMALGKYQEGSDCLLQAIKINANFKEAIEVMASISTHENAIQWRRMAKNANNRDLLWTRTKVETPSDVIFLAPHNDDETLFGAFTLMRVKPLVIIVTDSYIQPERGDVGCTAEIRRQETIEAMKIAECPVLFLGIKDTELTEEVIRERLQYFNPEQIYVPAIQGGNAHHDLVGKVAMDLFGKKCERYTTYTKTELYTTGNYEVKPTPVELEKKDRMMDCYNSQWELPSTLPHFKAVIGKSEWLL
jgi:LmbE family N-acetylglucosaminyl deacetylase